MLLSFIVFCTALVALPATTFASVPRECDGSTSFLGMPTWYKYLDIGPKQLTRKDGDKTIVIGTDDCAIIGPTDHGEFSIPKALPRIGLALADILLRVAGLVAVGFVIYGGLRYITAQGEPESLKSAQATIINALIGIVIAILATTIVTFIGSQLWS
jgi:hypothetical protein